VKQTWKFYAAVQRNVNGVGEEKEKGKGEKVKRGKGKRKRKELFKESGRLIPSPPFSLFPLPFL
jgi:hypothetical protein